MFNKLHNVRGSREGLEPTPEARTGHNSGLDAYGQNGQKLTLNGQKLIFLKQYFTSLIYRLKQLNSAIC